MMDYLKELLNSKTWHHGAEKAVLGFICTGKINYPIKKKGYQ